MGWSSGDVGILEGGKLVWQVYAHKGETKLLAKSANRDEAWQDVVRMWCGWLSTRKSKGRADQYGSLNAISCWESSPCH